MELKTESYARQDNEGNILYVRFTLVDGVKCTASVVLKLAGHKRYRNIGLITLKDNTLHVKRKSDSHFHYRAGGYGFNWEMLNEKIMFRIDHIHLIVDDKKEYIFPKEAIVQYGRFLFFKEQNFELQKFLAMEFIEPFEYIKKEEKII